MQKIVPHLWFDTEAKEAADFYVKAFEGLGETAIITTNTLRDTPSGDADTVSFRLGGYEFMAISAGPYFTKNPSISFMVNFDPSSDSQAREHLDKLWNALSDGGVAMMPLGEYPFSPHYGWIQDKYGVSWQLILTDPGGDPRPFIMPSLLFVTESGKVCEQAVDLYLSVFKDAKRGTLAHYPAGMEPNPEGAVMFSDFTLNGQWFTAMDGPSAMHTFAFNEGISLIVRCENQEEIDYYWNKLSAVPESDLPAPQPNAFYIYVIKCRDGSMYIGQTKDIKERLRKHEAGVGAEHTKKYKPIQIIHYEKYKTREEAVKREHDLKTGFGRKWLQREYKAGRTRQAGQCGWLKDKYGVSWQIVPTLIDKMMREGSEQQINAVTQAFLQMKKFDIAKLEEVYQSNQ